VLEICEFTLPIILSSICLQNLGKSEVSVSGISVVSLLMTAQIPTLFKHLSVISPRNVHQTQNIVIWVVSSWKCINLSNSQMLLM
jgi:hypothetical protein